MTRTGRFSPLMIAWICSTVSGEKNSSPVSRQTRAGTCSTTYSLFSYSSVYVTVVSTIVSFMDTSTLMSFSLCDHRSTGAGRARKS